MSARALFPAILAGFAIAMLAPAAGGAAGESNRSAARQGLGSLPAAARSAVSAAIGAESRAFFARRSGDGYRLGGGGVAADLDARSVDLRAGDVSVSMAVAGLGRGGRLDRSEVLSVGASANRVSLVRAGMTEWYAAGPLGIEQGFTLSRRPAGHAGPVTVALRLTGGVHARQAPSGAVFLARRGQAGLSYGALSATDSRGRRLRAALRLRDDELTIRVWDRGATYPLLIDPLIQQGSKLTGGGETGPGQFGASVALSADGNTALIGGYADSDSAGAAWVFTRSGTTWTQQGPKLTGGGETGAGYFGVSVALSADGNTALIGGYADSDSVGAAWVFTRTAGTWTQQGAKLTGNGESGFGEFGFSVALSSDGNTALIGGDADASVGAAWVFTRSGVTWTQQGSKLTGSGEIGNGHFGWSAALSSDGRTALIGGPFDHASVGAAWVFIRSSGVWTQQGSKLTGTDEVDTGVFGESVALSGDGNTALVGGDGDDNDLGAAWVFTRSAGTWTQQGAKLTGTGATDDAGFGYSVALSSDGSTALIGGWLDNLNDGAVWVFTRSGGTWTQQGSKLTGGGETDDGLFGGSVALSADATTALVGGPGDNLGVGAAWVFTPATVPGAPTGVSAVAGNGQAVVSFSAPASDGGLAIGSFTVTASPGGASVSGAASPITVPGLSNGTAYTFTVTATNAVGTGAASAPSGAVTPATVPGPPTGVSAVAGNAQAVVSFTGPASNGGAAVSSFTVTASPGGASMSGPGSPITVAGLSNGSAYTFTVAATNAVGTGAASAPSGAVTPATVPGAPSGVSAVAENGQAVVSFSGPASNGGAAIGSFTVTASPGGATASGAASPITVPGLSNGTAYTFTVTATNAVGTGAASAPSSPVTPGTSATVPGAPTAVLVSAGDGEVTVSFTAPASNGGAAITSYVVTASPGGQTVTRYASPVFVSGLANGTSYTFTVAATNVAGTGPPSVPSSPAVPSSSDGRPAPAPPSEQPRTPPPPPPTPVPRPAVPVH